MPLSQPRVVLIIEPNDSVRSLIVELLEIAGHRTIAASSYSQAVTSLDQTALDVVLSVPRITEEGKTVEVLRHCSATRHVPLVIMSGGTPFDFRGAAFVSKPFSWAKLRAALSEAINQRYG